MSDPVLKAENTMMSEKETIFFYVSCHLVAKMYTNFSCMEKRKQGEYLIACLNLNQSKHVLRGWLKGKERESEGCSRHLTLFSFPHFAALQLMELLSRKEVLHLQISSNSGCVWVGLKQSLSPGLGPQRSEFTDKIS